MIWNLTSYIFIFLYTRPRIGKASSDKEKIENVLVGSNVNILTMKTFKSVFNIKTLLYLYINGMNIYQFISEIINDYNTRRVKFYC